MLSTVNKPRHIKPVARVLSFNGNVEARSITYVRNGYLHAAPWLIRAKKLETVNGANLFNFFSGGGGEGSGPP